MRILILFLIERKTDARTGAAQDPRWILWAGGLKIAEDWLYIGSGPGSQIYEYEKADIWITYAHNLWIQAFGRIWVSIYDCSYLWCC